MVNIGSSWLIMLNGAWWWLVTVAIINTSSMIVTVCHGQQSEKTSTFGAQHLWIITHHHVSRFPLWQSWSKYSGFFKWAYPEIIQQQAFLVINHPFWGSQFQETILHHERSTPIQFWWFGWVIRTCDHAPIGKTYKQLGLRVLFNLTPAAPDFFVPKSNNFAFDWESQCYPESIPP